MEYFRQSNGAPNRHHPHNSAGGARAQAGLSNTDLRGADLRYADLYEANLSNANLTGARLEFATIPDGSTYNQGYVQPINPSQGCDPASDGAVAEPSAS